MADDKQFAAGIYFEAPRESAPEFVKGRMSFKVAEAVAFLQQHENNAGYVNCDVKESKGGKLYVELNAWKPEGRPEVAQEEPEGAGAIEYPTDDINPDDIPF